MRRKTLENIEKYRFYLTVAFEISKTVSAFTLMLTGWKYYFVRSFYRSYSDADFAHNLPLYFFRRSSCLVDEMLTTPSQQNHFRSYWKNTTCVPLFIQNSLAISPYYRVRPFSNETSDMFPGVSNFYFIFRIPACIVFSIILIALPFAQRKIKEQIQESSASPALQQGKIALFNMVIWLIKIGMWFTFKSYATEYQPKLYFDFTTSYDTQEKMFPYPVGDAIFTSDILLYVLSGTLGLAVGYVMIFGFIMCCCGILLGAGADCESPMLCAAKVFKVAVPFNLLVFSITAIAFSCIDFKLSPLSLPDLQIWKEIFLNFNYSILSEPDFIYTVKLPIFLTISYTVFNAIADGILVLIDRIIQCREPHSSVQNRRAGMRIA